MEIQTRIVILHTLDFRGAKNTSLPAILLLRTQCYYYNVITISKYATAVVNRFRCKKAESTAARGGGADGNVTI